MWVETYEKITRAKSPSTEVGSPKAPYLGIIQEMKLRNKKR